MFSRREMIIGAFERKIENEVVDVEELTLTGNHEPNWHTFSGLKDYGEVPLIDDEMEEEATIGESILKLIK